MLLVAAVALYSPVRNYYVAKRTGQVLQVKYDQLSDENAGLTYDVNRLQTKQGIEDEAAGTRSKTRSRRTRSVPTAHDRGAVEQKRLVCGFIG